MSKQQRGKMPETFLKPQDQMMQWITSKWITRPIHVVAQLGIADLLSEKPLGVEVLAEETDTHAPTLCRLLRALSAVGIFQEMEGCVFAMTPLAQCLRSDAMRPLALMFLSDWHDKAWSGLTHCVRTGKPGFGQVFGKAAFEWMEENPDARAILDHAQGTKALGFAREIIKACDFRGLNTICDLGGGSGVFLRIILAAYPHLKGIVADLPGAIAGARQIIAEANLQDRFDAVPCDFFKAAPPPCDAFFLVNVLHDWDDDRCIIILGNLYRIKKTNRQSALSRSKAEKSGRSQQ
jgi:hypothetical protein